MDRMRYTFARQGGRREADVDLELDAKLLAALNAALRAHGANRLADQIRQRTRRIELTHAEVQTLNDVRSSLRYPSALSAVDDL